MGDVRVHRLEQTLLWPIRLRPSGKLSEIRDSPKHSETEWLDAYGREIAKDGKWKPLDDYFPIDSANRLGVTEDSRYAEVLYFHPFIQRIFFRRGRERPIRILQRDDVLGARVTVSATEAPRDWAVRRVQLFLFPTDVAIVAVQIGLPEGPEEGKPVFDDALRFLNRARRAFAPYWTQEGPGQCPASFTWLGSGGEPILDTGADFADRARHFVWVQKHRSQPMSRHWQALLSPLEPYGSEPAGPLTFEHFDDDRIPCMAYVQVDDAAKISEPDQMRLAFLEEPGAPDVTPYAKAFVEKFDEEFCYDRFYDPPRLTTRYLVAGYGFTLLGSRHDWFFANLIPGHFQQHYFLMGLMAHVQKASLLVYWDRLSEIMHDYAKESAGETSRREFRERHKWLTEDFADFVGRFWFSEVSNQVQGLELFRMWSKQLGTPQLYSEVGEQIRFLQEVADNQFQAESTEYQSRVARLSNTWLPLALATGVLGMDGAFDGTADWFKEHRWFIPGWSVLPYKFWFQVALLAVVYLLIRWVHGRLERHAEAKTALQAKGVDPCRESGSVGGRPR